MKTTEMTREEQKNILLKQVDGLLICIEYTSEYRKAEAFAEQAHGVLQAMFLLEFITINEFSIKMSEFKSRLLDVLYAVNNERG